MDIPVEWLLEGEPYIEYRTRTDLMSQADADPLVASARAAMLADPRVKALVEELAGWPGTVISSHKSAGQPFHKLTFLADLGLKATDPGMDVIIDADHGAPIRRRTIPAADEYFHPVWWYRAGARSVGVVRCTADCVCPGPLWFG